MCVVLSSVMTHNLADTKLNTLFSVYCENDEQVENC